jgi:hypothetical protein
MHRTTKTGKESLYCTPRVDRLGGIAKTLPVAFELALKRLPSCRSINFRLQKAVGGREYHAVVLPRNGHGRAASACPRMTSEML